MSWQGTPSGPDLPAVAALLLRYLLDHPRARDTQEGIRAWWLGAAGRRISIETLAGLLDELERRKWLIARAAKTGERTYGMNAECVAEIEAYLRDEEDQA